MSDNPYESPIEAKPTAIPRSFRFTFGGVAITLLAVLVVIALLVPAERGARESARRNSCINNLKQIGLALHNYNDVHGTLPPAYTVDENGNRLHSWRTLILPFMEEKELYDTIDLTKPWDDPVNAKARETTVYGFRCPSGNHEDPMTTYLAIVDPDCAFSGPDGRKFSEVADDPSKSMMIVDVNSDRAVHWMSPNDVSKEELLSYGPETETNHREIIYAFLDGHVEGFSLKQDREEFRAMLTSAEGKAATD